jgi:hypothetical protein
MDNVMKLVLAALQWSFETKATLETAAIPGPVVKLNVAQNSE